MNLPLVSIITPTYNHEKYIADCISSAQSQTYSNWEMLLVDDGSTDNTLSIAKDLAALDSRIKVFTQKNIGIFRLSETYNFALTNAKGKYIAVLEGDDVWLPEKLSIQVNALEKNEDAVLSWGKAYRSDNTLSINYDLYPFLNIKQSNFNNLPVKSASKDLFFIEFFMPALTVIIRKESLNKIGGFIQKFNLPLVDLPTWLQLSTLGSFIYIDEPIGKWRIYPTQITKIHTVRMYEGYYQLALEFFEQNKDYYENLSVKESDIHSHYQKMLVISYSRSGRYKLIRKEFISARKDYLKSIFSFGFNKPLWKLRSVIGLIFSLFHTDIEKLTKKIGRVSYK